MRLICAPPILTKGARTNDKAVMFALRHRSGGQGYSKDAKVSHNGKHWTSTVDSNVWEPGVYGWTEV